MGPFGKKPKEQLSPAVPVRDRLEAPWLPGSDSARTVKERRSRYFAGAPSAFILDTITPGGGEFRSPAVKSLHGVKGP